MDPDPERWLPKKERTGLKWVVLGSYFLTIISKQVHARRVQEAQERQKETREVHRSPGLLVSTIRASLNCNVQGTDVGKSETFDYSGKLAASREAAGKQASPEPQVPFLTMWWWGGAILSLREILKVSFPFRPLPLVQELSRR